jgi:hypothetical protein
MNYLGLGLCVLFSAGASAASFTIAAVGAFGEPLTECRVDSFRSSTGAAGEPREYKNSFQGIVASDLPDGEYEAVIHCQGARLQKSVKINYSSRFEVVTQYRRIMRSDHVIPHLAVHMSVAIPPGETWWLTLRAVYDDRTYTTKFQNETGAASVADPDPGSYVVSVHSTAGYDCLREIDLAEPTRLWKFHPAACKFHVDQFAHVVTDEDKREHKTTDWYRQLQKRDEELFRELEDAAKAEEKTGTKK